MRIACSHRLLLLIMSAVVWSGCTKVQEEEELVPELSFSFDLPAMPIILDSAAVASPSGMVLALDSTALAQALEARGYLPGQVLGASINKATLYSSTPVNGTYDAVGSVQLQLAAGDAAPVTVAALDPVPAGAQTLLLDLSGPDVQHVLQGHQPRLCLRMVFDGPLTPQSSHLLVLGARVELLP